MIKVNQIYKSSIVQFRIAEIAQQLGMSQRCDKVGIELLDAGKMFAGTITFERGEIEDALTNGDIEIIREASE